jgi:hypothetical protein
MGGALRNNGYGLVTYSDLMFMDSLTIRVTDIEAGYTVRMYDAADVEMANGTEAGGGYVDLLNSTLDFRPTGFEGYFTVETGVGVVVRRMPYTGTFTGLYGGDVWPGNATPEITPPLVPTHGPVGTNVIINGTDFGPDAILGMVTFGGATATIVSWTNTQIVATVPGLAVTGNVVVTKNGVASAGVPFTVDAPIPPTPGPPQPGWPDYIVGGWSSEDPAGTPATGRMINEDGDVINIADVLATGAATVVRTGLNPGVPRTGRFLMEDGTVINLADMLGG